MRQPEYHPKRSLSSAHNGSSLRAKSSNHLSQKGTCRAADGGPGAALAVRPLPRDPPADFRRKCHRPSDLIVAHVPLALLQRTLGRQQHPVTSLRQPMRRHVQFARQGLQALAPHQPLHHVQLPLRREARARASLGPGSASVWGARRRGRGLRCARFLLVVYPRSLGK